MDGTGDKAGGTAGDEEAQAAASLVARIREGDRRAEDLLVRRYSRGLMFMLRRRTNGDEQLAEDIHQDVFRIVLERLRGDGIDDARRLAGFIHSTGKNVLIGILRRRQRRKTHADSELIDAAIGQDDSQLDDTLQDERAAMVRRLLQELNSDRDRALLTRFYLHEEDKQSICAALELTDLHFNRVLYRAKQRFRELMEKDDDGAQEFAGGR